jgi:signal transduction histidine kinase/ligand-binding sensor domain-containing protein/CheY-like chemotaxis protein/AraC-like DNA-binding protein
MNGGQQLRQCFCVLLVLAGSLIARAQLKAKVERYTAEDGLSHDWVMAMIRDREGFMWFGTWDGINRFDGHSFVTYKSQPGDSSILKSNRIDIIAEDSDGYLWLRAYDGQIYRFDKRAESFMAITERRITGNRINLVFRKIYPAKRKGFVWLITRKQGVFCIRESTTSKPQITAYDAGEISGFRLPPGDIHFLREDSHQRIWIGAEGGLACLADDGTGIFRTVRLSLKHKDIAVTCFAEDRERIWFGTGKGYVISLEKRNGRFSEKKITTHRINGISVSGNTRHLYLSTAQSEIITLTKTNFSLQVAKMNGAPAFFSIYEDRSGVLWIEPEKRGVIRFDPSSRKFTYMIQEKDGTFINPAESYAVFEDVRNNVWVNMKGGGFGYYDPQLNGIAYFYNKPGSPDQLFSNLVSSHYYDPAGVLWFSGIDRGINKLIFPGNNFENKLLVTNPVSRSDNSIRAIYSDREGRLWLTSKAGEIRITRNGQRMNDLFVNMPSRGIGIVYSIYEDSKANIWLGTKSNGLYKASPLDKGHTKYTISRVGIGSDDRFSLKSTTIYSIFEDLKGRLWIGTFDKGIQLLVGDGKRTRFLNSQNTFKYYPKGPFSKIRTLSCDRQGNIWIGTTNGLVILDPSGNKPGDWRFTTYTKVPGDKSSLGNNDVQYIYRDSKGRMWVSTSGGGLNEAIPRAKGIAFKSYTKADGLPSDYIVSMAEDDRGDLWLASENGLSRFTPELKQFRNFNSYDGISEAGFSETSSLKLPDGRLLFGTMAGYLIFHPKNITDHKIIASLVFTNLRINNKDVSPVTDPSILSRSINHTNQLTLDYNENTVGINYTVLDYRSGNKQAFAYRLKGFDSGWHDVKNQHSATYTNLPPGDYVFELKTLNADLYSNILKRKLSITILPPPWRSAWAYAMYAVLAVITIVIAIRIARTMLRLKHNIAVEKRLTELKLNFFTNISHELRTPLTLIVNPLTAVSTQENLSVKGREYLMVALKNAGRMVRFINQLLDFRKVQSGKIVLNVARLDLFVFVKEIGAYFFELACEKQIHLRFTPFTRPVFACIDPEKMDVVMYNLLTNALKFSEPHTEINVSVEEDDAGNPLIRVADQGIGIPEAKLADIFDLYYTEGDAGHQAWKGTGIGLALSKELVEAHQGTITAKNNPGKGLTITVQLLAANAHFSKDRLVTWHDHPDEVMYSEEGNDDTQERQNGVAGSDGIPLILIVEDNQDLRKFLVDQFAGFYRIAEAENGKQGLEAALKLIPDLVLSDVIMPEMDGIAMLDALKNNPVTSHIPVIILSAKSSVENQIRGLRYGADYYIAKPFHAEFVRASVENLIRLRKQLFNLLVAGGEPRAGLSPAEVVITSRDEEFLKQVIRIVESGMTDPDFNIEAVAESVNMGRTAFYKKFKGLTGQAPVEFVKDMRLKRGKQLLDAGQNNITEVAYSVGFSSPGYFSTCFKEAYRISPKEYAKGKQPVPVKVR